MSSLEKTQEKPTAESGQKSAGYRELLFGIIAETDITSLNILRQQLSEHRQDGVITPEEQTELDGILGNRINEIRKTGF